MKPRLFKFRICPECGDEYVPTGPGQKRCSKPDCRLGKRVCAQCDASFYPAQKASAQEFCSPACARLGRRGTTTTKLGQGHGRYLTVEGYITVRVPVGTPGAQRKSPTTPVMLEHRFVAQQHLGRPLRADETVHHINGDKRDNRWENLQIRTGKHGNGTVLACGDCGSRNVVHVPLA